MVKLFVELKFNPWRLVLVEEVAETSRPCCEVEEPDFSMLAAAEVAEAMASADTESGWLCVPSYVVIKTDMSSAHLCTCFLTGQDDETVQR